MPIIASDSGTVFEPAPEGLHQSVCVDVVDLGIVQTNFGPVHKVQIRWETEQHYKDDKGKDRPYMVVSSYRLSLNEKSNLYKIVTSWRGRKFTADELKGFDLEKLVGVNCQLQVVHNIGNNGTTYANVQAVVPIGKNTTKIRPSDDYVRVVDRDVNENGHGPNAEAVSGNDDDIPF